jgi:hypothetical protein
MKVNEGTQLAFRGFVPGFALAVLMTAAGGAASADSLVTSDAFLPVVHIVGATGVFRSDVWIFNPNRFDVTARLYYTPADADGTNLGGIRITPDLHSRESVTLTDIVGNPAYFNYASSYGLLEVRTSAPVIVTSNLYNIAGATPGTYGQFAPGQPFRNALGFDNTDNGLLYVTGIPNDPNFRTNAVAMNPTGVTLEAGVQLVDAIGNVWASNAYTVLPFSMHQINDIFGAEFAAANPPPENGPYRLNFFVNLANGARILCYASITDKRTGDPYMVVGQAQTP